MEEIKNSDREGLAARVNALRVAEQALRQNKPEAIQAVRRISRSLRIAQAANHHPEITAIAATLEEAADDALAAQLQKVLPQLRSLAANISARRVAVLVVEDDPVTAQILQQRLHAINRDSFIARNISEAESVLSEHDIALVL